MPNAVPPPSADADKVKMESAVSSAAASPAPSVASSKDDRVRTTTKTCGADGKDKDQPESSVEDSVDTDMMMDIEKKTGDVTAADTETGEKELPLAGEDLKKDLSEKLQKELKKEEVEEPDSKEDTKDSIGELCVTVCPLNVVYAVQLFAHVRLPSVYLACDNFSNARR